MFPNYKQFSGKNEISRQDQVNIVCEIEKKLQELTANKKENLKSFKIQVKKILKEIKFSIDTYRFDDDVADTLLKIGLNCMLFLWICSKRDSHIKNDLAQD